MGLENRLIDKWSYEIMGHGFTAVPNLLIEYRQYLGISVTDFYVLLAIEKYRWDNFQKPWPSLKALSELTNLSERTIGRSTKSLEDVGLIKRIQRAGTSNLYDMEPLIEELDYIAAKLTKVTNTYDNNDHEDMTSVASSHGHVRQ